MVRLILYNIEYCAGLKGRWYEYLNFFRELFFVPKGHDQKIVDALKELNPDILGLVEVDTGSPRAKKDEVVFFKDGLKMQSYDEAIKYIRKGMGKIYCRLPIMGMQGNALISKYKIGDVKHHVLSKGVKRIVIEVTVHCPKKVTLLLAHLALGRKTRKKQIHDLVKIVNDIHNPVILMGDLNTTKGEEELIELMVRTHLKFKTKMNKNLYTQPTYKPSKLFDYVLTSPKIRVNNYQVLSIALSDHLPVLVDFEVE